MRKGVFLIPLILANDHILDGFLVVARNSLGHATQRGTDEHGYLESHGVVRNVHLVVLDGKLDFGSDHVGILINGYLVDWWIVFFLLFSFLLLFLLWSHRSFLYIYYYSLLH